MKKLFLLFLLLTFTNINAQVLINEVMHYPSGAQGLNGSGKEYIELFNNNPCASVNIGCWMLGFADVDGFVNNRGCIQLPPNIILPPYSHYVIGTSSSSLDSNSIDFKINRNPSNLCSVGSFLLANGDGWVGLYDEAGIVVDAIYWTVNGGSWQRNVTASINDLSGGNCNGGSCLTSTFNLNATVSQPSCNSSNGGISFNPQPAVTYFYNWPFPTTGQTSSFNNLAAGSYSITITSASGCSKDTTIVLAASNGPTAVVVSESDPGCSQSNGSVTIVSVTGGTPQYQYNFNNLGFSNSQNYTNLPAGTYPLTVKDVNGCEFNAPDITLMSPNGPTAVTINKNDPGCSQSNGSVTIVSVTGGTPQYQYNFNNLGFSNSQNYTNLPAGTYLLTVKDANGCEFTSPIITLNNPNSPSGILYTSTPAKCDKTRGTITVSSVTGGVSPYTYSINGGPFTTDLLYDSLNVGTYPLIVKDANGCVFTEIINITSSSPLNAAFTANVQPGSNDSLTAGTTSGNYFWNYSSQNETLNAFFINSSTAGSGISYNWIFNIGSVSDTTTTSLNDLYQNFQGSNTINVTLIVTNGDETCNDTASIVIDIKSIIQIPTIFSPNGDGINDVFFIKYRGYKDLTMTIFNRWGNKYYETTKPEEGWTGNDAAEGTYFYIVNGKSIDDKVFESKGYFMLVR